MYQSFYAPKVLEGQIENMKKRLADEKDPAARAKLQTQLLAGSTAGLPDIVLIQDDQADDERLHPPAPHRGGRLTA